MEIIQMRKETNWCQAWELSFLILIRQNTLDMLAEYDQIL